MRALLPGWDYPESTRSLICEQRPQPPQQSPSNSCPSHGREDSRPPKIRLRGCGGPGAEGRESPGNLMYSTRLGALPLPSSQAAPAFPLGGLCNLPTGTSPPCSFAGRGKWGPRSQSNRIRVLAGHRRGLDPAQRLCRYSMGASRAESAFEVDLIL